MLMETGSLIMHDQVSEIRSKYISLEHKPQDSRKLCFWELYKGPFGKVAKMIYTYIFASTNIVEIFSHFPDNEAKISHQRTIFYYQKWTPSGPPHLPLYSKLKQVNKRFRWGTGHRLLPFIVFVGQPLRSCKTTYQL